MSDLLKKLAFTKVYILVSDIQFTLLFRAILAFGFGLLDA